MTGDVDSPGPDRVEAVQAAWRRELPDLDVSSVGVVGRLLDVAHSVERVRAAERDKTPGSTALTEARSLSRGRTSQACRLQKQLGIATSRLGSFSNLIIFFPS